MPIDLFEIENLFGDNNSWKVPNAIPTEFKRQKLNANLRPNLINALGGSIKLTGSNGNYCKYKGRYYFLKRGDIRHFSDEPDKCRWMYYLVDDVGANEVLSGKVFVKGCVDIGNNPAELEANIDRCIPLIDNLANVTRYSIGTVDRWNDFIRVKKITTRLPQKVVSAESLRAFKSSLNGSAASRGKIAKDKYKGRHKAIYIFGALHATDIHEGGGKNKVIDKVNEFLDSEEFKNAKLVKINQTAVGAGSKLINKYAVSYQDGGIGAIEDEVTLREIDLSQLTDVVALDTNTLKKRDQANKELNEKTGVFVIKEDKPTIYDLCLKIRRKAFLPLNNDYFYEGRTKGVAKYWPPRVADGEYKTFNFQTYTQKIQFKEDTNLGSAFLYYVDKLNFVLDWKTNFSGLGYTVSNNDRALTRYLGNLFYGNSDGSNFAGPYYSSTSPGTAYAGEAGVNRSIIGLKGITTKLSRKFKEGNLRTGPHWPISDGSSSTSHNTWLWDNLGDACPGYGILMFGLAKEGDRWNSFEYIGVKQLENVAIFTGFNRNFIEKYKDPNRFWSNIEGTKLGELANNVTVSKFLLDIDNLLFRYFTPDIYENYEYRYDWYNAYDAINSQILRNPTNEEYYVGSLVLADLNGRVNPYGDIAKFRTGQQERQTIIDSVTIKDTINLPLPLNKGDYLFDSLTYRFQKYDNSHGLLTADKYKDDFNTNAGYARTLDELEDFIGADQFSEFPEVDYLDGSIVCCTNTDGTIGLRYCNKYTYNAKLSEANNQIVKSVNGAFTTPIDYGGLHKLEEENTKLNVDSVVDPDILAFFYKAHGYNTRIAKAEGEGQVSTAFFEWFDDEDFASERGWLFDLVGTDGYAYIRSNKVHLIAKDVEKFRKVADDKSKKYKLTETPEIKALSLTERINRINYAHFKTYPIQLKAKNLNNALLTVEGLGVTNLQAVNDNFRICLQTDYDLHDERVAIPKESVNIQQIGDQISLDAYELQQQNALIERNKGKALIELDKYKANTSASRAKGDLDYEKTEQVADLITGAVTGLGGLLTGGISAGKGFLSAGNLGSPALTTAAGIHMGARTLKSARGGAKGLRWLSTAYPEEARRIEEDKSIRFQDIAFKSFALNESFYRERKQNTLAVERLTNQYVSDYVNDTTLAKKYMEKLGVDEIYIKVMTPSAEQLRLINKHYQEYGVDCEIYDMPVVLTGGMPENVVRFRFINDDGLVGVTDPLKRELLSARLLSGVKIVEVGKSNPSYSGTRGYDGHAAIEIYVDEIEGLENLVSRKEEEIQEGKIKVKVLTNEKDAALKENQKLVLETESLKLQTKEQIEEANRKLTTLENEKTQLETQITAKSNELNTKTRQIGALNGKIADLEGELATSKDLVDKLKESKKALEDENKALAARKLEDDPTKKPGTLGSIEDYLKVLPQEKRNGDQIEEYWEEFVKYFNVFNNFGLNVYERQYEFLGMIFVMYIMRSLQMWKLAKAAGLNPKPIPWNSYFASGPNRIRFKSKMAKFMCGYEDPQDPLIKSVFGSSSSVGGVFFYNNSEHSGLHSLSNNSYFDAPNQLKGMMKYIITIVEEKLCMRTAVMSGNVELQNMARDRIETFNSVNGSIGYEAFYMNQYGLMNYTASKVWPDGGYYSGFNTYPRAMENLYICMFARNDVLINYIFNNGPTNKSYDYYKLTFSEAKELCRYGFTFHFNATAQWLFIQLILLNTGASYNRPGRNVPSGGLDFTIEKWPDKMKDIANFLWGSRNIAGENIKGPFYDYGKNKFNGQFINLTEFEKQVHNHLLHNADGGN